MHSREDVFWAALIVAFVALCICASTVKADVGFAHGIGPHLPHPLTPHVGRFYYKPGQSDAAAKIESAPTELEQFLATPKRAQKETAKLRCDRYHVEYVFRHGVTTPRPLKGFTGCKKYAMDAGYWRSRHNDGYVPLDVQYLLTNTIPNHVEIGLHNAVLPW